MHIQLLFCVTFGLFMKEQIRKTPKWILQWGAVSKSTVARVRFSVEQLSWIWKLFTVKAAWHIQEGMTLIYHWTYSQCVRCSILMRDVGSSYWHLSPSMRREEIVKVSCTEVQINGATSCSRLPPVSSRLTAGPQFDGLDLYFSITI